MKLSALPESIRAMRECPLMSRDVSAFFKFGGNEAVIPVAHSEG